jgi:hypothetical protein
MYDFHKIRIKDKSKEFRHRYFKKGQLDLLKFIKRKTPDQQGYFESCQKNIDTLLVGYNELKEDYEELKNEKLSKLAELGDLLSVSKNKTLKVGMNHLAKVVTQVSESGLDKVDDKVQQKYILIEKLFQDFDLIDAGLFNCTDSENEASISIERTPSTAENSDHVTETLSDSDSYEDQCIFDMDEFLDCNLGKRNFENRYSEPELKEICEFQPKYKIEFCDDFFMIKSENLMMDMDQDDTIEEEFHMD